MIRPRAQHRRAVRVATRIYKLLLLLYPARLRREYAGSILATLQQAERERAGSSLRFWVYMYYDLLHSSLHERLIMSLRRPVAFYVACFAVLVTVMGGCAAITMQQTLRRGANQPQIQMADEAVAALTHSSPDEIIPHGYVDMQRSLQPFVIFYDESGTPVAGTGYLDNVRVAPPPGVFNYARAHGQDTLTWQPQPAVRVAAVIRHVSGPHPGFVLAGRSLRTVEQGEATLRHLTFAGWFLVMLLLFVVVVLSERAQHRSPASA